MIKPCIVAFLLLLSLAPATAQPRPYTIKIPSAPTDQLTPLPFTGHAPNRTTLTVNNRYFERNGAAWLPLMGEMHYNRVPEQNWETGLRTMKAAGAAIVATYVFWNEHERQPGQWTWSGRRNLRRFLDLCQQHGLMVWLRIGPWSHGEQLHGGFPDWINKLPGNRSNDSMYLAAATKLFHQIGQQTRGHFFADGGPIVGVQLENEYASGSAEHITTLKKMALDAGIKPVYWSITANTVFDDKKLEVIPLQGAYPYRGWERNGGKATKDFLYANDQWIMTDALGKLYYDPMLFPKGLCEQGAGSQMTYANRFVVEPDVVAAHLQNQLGRGMNLIGYYMFHGGTQTPGLKEPGHPESYDFQAPIAEFGRPRESYHQLKILHHFINDFGTELAAMRVVEPPNPVRDELNTTDLRYIVREKNNSGFLFLCNTQVRLPMPDKLIQPSIELNTETIRFPAFVLKGETAPVLPFNLKVNNLLIKHATAQPLAKLQNGPRTTLVFMALDGVPASFHIQAPGKQNAQTQQVPVGGSLTFKEDNGIVTELVVVSHQDALKSWRINEGTIQVLLISDGNLQRTASGLEIRQLDKPNLNLQVYPAGIINQLINNDGLKLLPKKNRDELTLTVAPVKQPNSIVQPTPREATVTVPPNLPRQLSDILVTVKYEGDSAHLTAGDSLITDNLNNGTPWQFPLKAIGANGKFLIKTLPGNSVIKATIWQPEYIFSIFFKTN